MSKRPKSSKAKKPKNKSKKPIAWYAPFLEGLWYRGTDATGKGVGVAFLGEGFYLTWARYTAETFAQIAEMRTHNAPPKLGIFQLAKKDLNLLDSRSKVMFEIKKSMNVDPYAKIDSPLFSRILAMHVKDRGYDGVIDSNPADGLMLLDGSYATQIDELILKPQRLDIL